MLFVDVICLCCECGLLLLVSFVVAVFVSCCLLSLLVVGGLRCYVLLLFGDMCRCLLLLLCLVVVV